MEHFYKGWIIERMIDSDDKHFNLRPEYEEHWTDGAQTLRDAKAMIDELPSERTEFFSSLEFKNLARYDNGDLHVDFWNEDFIWLTDAQKDRLTGDDQTRLDNCEEELAWDMAALEQEMGG
jgi:Asp-tRNA(Asn)/Glu-tRNA(Gln) amidotransferase A subunit family amidase|tara:strand:+ start:163 stop:525 length:363 start_codon:yes stop_codon:yes gene_type:complete